MAEPAAGTQLTLLGSTEPVDDDRLAELYAYPPADPSDGGRCWVRSNFIASLDGAATLYGRSGDLAGPGDRALFQMMRELADVVLVGAGTIRVENYSGVQLGASQREARRGRGQSEVPPVAIVTQSGRLDRDLRVFTNTEVPPLVLTCTDSVPEATARLGGHAEVIDSSGAHPSAVDPEAALHALATRGLLRVLTEGGPTLQGALVEQGLLDELCLTVAPVIVAGDARRITHAPLEKTISMRRAHLLSDEAGYLYSRYVRDGEAGA
ncbi:pyrimidine reductase family protein [Mycolicibacterium palauense]|uniref:pyrimidine reductase family protein n=1 Tax=Mycolicibacterium palauense TaxID=2034511 RepID=UPI00159BD347|nr:pyrimidine reductase family protein [Mycolicibacterium palauense]